jgi:outer membrane lipoprotein-sorting protein
MCNQGIILAGGYKPSPADNKQCDKENTLKKTLIIALTALMALTLGVTACGGSRTTTTQPATTKATVTTATATVTPTGIAPTTTTPVPTTATTSATTSRPATTTTSPPSTTAVKTTTTAATSSQPATTVVDIAAILGKAGAVKSLSYDMVTTSGTVNMTAKIYMKGTKMRMDISQSGIDMRTYIDTDAKTVYIYTVYNNTLMKSTWTDSNESAAQKSGDILGYNPVVKGTATIDGKLCTIIEYTYGDSGNTVNAKAWIWNENGLPIKMEITDKSGTTTIEYNNISLADIADSVFVLPAGASTFVIPTGLPTGYPGT